MPCAKAALMEVERLALILIFEGDGRGSDVKHTAIRHELVDIGQLAVDQRGGVLGGEENPLQMQPVEGCCSKGFWRSRRRS